jgi:putative protein kinase ArgK-like GTPase of G3E family
VAALRRRHGDAAADDSTWVPPVLRVVATESVGVREVAATVDNFIAWSDRSGRRHQRTRERAYAQIMRALSALLLAPYARTTGTDKFPTPVTSWIERIAEGTASPLEAARALADEASR